MILYDFLIDVTKDKRNCFFTNLDGIFLCHSFSRTDKINTHTIVSRLMSEFSSASYVASAYLTNLLSKISKDHY